jgi:hypothetical protein
MDVIAHSTSHLQPFEDNLHGNIRLKALAFAKAA